MNHIIPMLLVFFLLFLKVVLSDLQFSQGVVFFAELPASYCSMHAHLFFHIHILLAYARTLTPSHVPQSRSHAHTIQCYCRDRFLFLLLAEFPFPLFSVILLRLLRQASTKRRKSKKNSFSCDDERRIGGPFQQTRTYMTFFSVFLFLFFFVEEYG